MSLVLIPDGPGTTIDLRDGQQGLPPAPRGSSAFLGQFSSGPVLHAALVLGAAGARLVAGEADDDFEASLAMGDLYAEDSPPVLIARITDGNEIQAQMPLWDRSPSRSNSRTQQATLFADRAPLATVKAHNGGRWAGAKQALLGDVATIATDLTATTLDISTAAETPAAGSYLVDRYKGADLFLQGDTSSPYTVSGSDANGVLSIEGEFSEAAQDADGTGAIDGRFRLVVPHGKELSVIIGTDSVTSSRFSLVGMRKFTSGADWEVATSYNDLGLSTDDDKPWLQTILEGEEEGNRFQLAVETSYTGATVEAKLPANFCESPTDVTGATMTFQWFRWNGGDTNTGNPYVDSVTPLDTAKIEPHTYDLTFTTATDFDVVITWADGTTQTLTAGTVAAAYPAAADQHPQMATFTITAGAVAAIAADTIKIRVDSLPHDLAQREAYVYPVAVSTDGNNNQRIRVASSTYNSVTVRADIVLGSFGATAGASPNQATTDLTAVSIGAAETVIMTPDGGTAVTLTSAGGAGPGAAAIQAELDSLDTDNIFTFTVVGDTVEIEVNGSFGSKSTITFGNGTAHASLVIPTTGTITGTDAVPARIEARMPMWGGYDGDTPTSAQYITALDLGSNLFDRWVSTNLGLVRFAEVGIFASAVKTAAEALAAKHGWKHVAEFDPSLEAQALPGEAALADMIANESESDYVDHLFPSRGKYLNVANTKLVTRSAVGQYMGIKSRLANVGADNEKGFHIAAANNNIQGKMSPRCHGLSDDIGRWTPPAKLLNDHGIVMLKWEGSSVYLWGNRMYSKGRTSNGRRYTITERDVFYHIARDLFVTTRPFIFKSISSRRLGDVQLKLREKMKTYHADGWFSDVAGQGFEQQVSVQVPLDLNPPENLQEGLVTASIQFRPRPALEDLKIIISPTQLSSEG